MDKNLKMHQDLVSIIMPAYNAEAFIRESIASVLHQTYINWELIVVDDGSTDRTAAIVHKLQANDSRIIYYKQNNGRLGAARNRGLQLAKGTWIAFLDSDDLWISNKLEVQLGAVSNCQKNVDIVFSAGYYLREKQLSPYNTLTGCYEGIDLYRLLLNHNHIPVLSVMIRRELSIRVGWQDTARWIHGNEDWDYWLRACRASGSFLGISERLFQYRVHDSGLSTKTTTMRLGGYYVICKNYDKKMLSPGDRRYHRRKILSEMPFVIKRTLKAEIALANGFMLLIKMLSIALSLSSVPEQNSVCA